MQTRAIHLAERVKQFSNEVIAFVQTLSDDDWTKVCDAEQWAVGVTAYHIGAGHLAIYQMADMIIQGTELPQLDMDQINAMSDKQAHDNADCTKADTLDQLNQNRDKMVAFIAGLSDQQLDMKGSMPAFQGDVTAEQLIEYVVFQSAAEHFQSIRSAVGH